MVGPYARHYFSLWNEPGINAAAWTFLRSASQAGGAAAGRGLVKKAMDSFSNATYTAKTDVQVATQLATGLPNLLTGYRRPTANVGRATKRRRTTSSTAQTQNEVAASLSLAIQNSMMGEEKFFDIAQSFLLTDGPVAGTDGLAFISDPLAQPLVGVGPSQRVGRKIRVIGIEIQLRLGLLEQSVTRGADPVGDTYALQRHRHTYRTTLIVDQQPNKGDLLYGDVFESPTSYEQPDDRYNVDGRSRFSILHDRLDVVQREVAPVILRGATPADDIRKFQEVSKFVRHAKPMNFEVSFSEDIDQTRIVTNDLRLFVNKDNNPASDPINTGFCHMNSRIWYLN